MSAERYTCCAVDSIATHYVKQHCHHQLVSNGIFLFRLLFLLSYPVSVVVLGHIKVERLSALSHPAKSLKIASIRSLSGQWLAVKLEMSMKITKK